MTSRDKLPGEYETGLSAYQGHPLDEAPGVSDQIVATLAALAITDIEQLIAVAAVPGISTQLAELTGLSNDTFTTFVTELAETLPPVRVAELGSPNAADLSQGALEPTIAMRTAQSAIQTPAPEAYLPELPAAVSWVKQMPPVRNQAQRGTCVAFAMTAMHEFYAQRLGAPRDYSEQHLYFETKLIDGIPDACGTYCEMAATVLPVAGQCGESIWPYDPNPPCNNHGVLPVNARPDGLIGRMGCVVLNPNDIFTIKLHLSSGSVVPFSIPVYNSWYLSAYARQTGRITMRIGNERAEGGHAMCLIGYQDDATAPGGGYFILRNSWDGQWGTSSPYGAGNGTIPYAYLANDGWEAIAADQSQSR